jgi:predicted ATPase
MIVEDAHWTDPSSLEVFGRVVDRIATLRALLIVTFRPEFEPPWVGRSYVTALTLNRLTRRELDTMIDRVVGNKPIPASIRQDIVERTDGIPLFVEEVTKAVLEAESDGDAKRTAAVVPFPARAVPATLHASLMARLDRLGSAKEVAQIGAALRREFSHARRLACCSAKVYRPTRPIYSNMPWCRMRLTAHCSGSREGRFILASSTFWTANLPKLAKVSRSCWRDTALKLA